MEKEGTKGKRENVYIKMNKVDRRRRRLEMEGLWKCMLRAMKKLRNWFRSNL